MKNHLLASLCCLLLFSCQVNAQQQKEVIPSDSIYTVVEEMPSFSGGEAKMMKYISSNIKYPEITKESGIQGRTTIRFVVGSDGVVRDVTVIRGINAAVDSM